LHFCRIRVIGRDAPAFAARVGRADPWRRPRFYGIPEADAVKAKAEHGDPDAQWRLALLIELSRKPDHAETWRWACLAANQGHKYAQVHVGGLEQDVSKAFMWYSLATSNGHPTASGFRDDLAKKMTPDQIAEAERLVKEWKPDPASCEIGNSPVKGTGPRRWM